MPDRERRRRLGQPHRTRSDRRLGVGRRHAGRRPGPAPNAHTEPRAETSDRATARTRLGRYALARPPTAAGLCSRCFRLPTGDRAASTTATNLSRTRQRPIQHNPRIWVSTTVRGPVAATRRPSCRTDCGTGAIGASVLPEAHREPPSRFAGVLVDELAHARTEGLPRRRPFEEQTRPHVEVGALVDEVLRTQHRRRALVQ
jgi:hypothetical protein